MERQYTGSISIGGTVSSDFEEAAIRSIPNPTLDTIRKGISFTDRRDSKLQKFVRMSTQAYLVDGIIRQAVDKYTELCGGFFLEGEATRVQYLTKRLEVMSLQSGEHWRTTLSRILHEYFKTGNAFFSKVRGNTPAAKRAFYTNKPYPIVSIFPISADRLEPSYNNQGHPLGWQFIDIQAGKSVNLTIPGTTRMTKDGAMVKLPSLPEDASDTLQKGLDIVHIAYKKGADTQWGDGITFAALEDVSLQRAVEQMAATVVKKNSHPIIHVKLNRPVSIMNNLQNEINQTAQLFRKSAPDGVIVTGPNTDIEAIGSESQALRLEGYLSHFTKRAFCSLGVSPYIMGFEGATLGTAQAAQAILLDRVRTAQEEFSQELQMFLLWEILWEGGFDPFNNTKDRVYLKFNEKDIERKIKEENHLIDMYVKGGIDVDELREGLGRQNKYNPSRLYLNQIQIPLAKVDHANNLDVAKIGAAARKKATKKEAREMVESFLPVTSDEVESFILLMEKVHDVDRDLLLPLQESLEKLTESGDTEAFMELMYQILCEEI